MSCVYGYAETMRINEIVGGWLNGYRTEKGLTLDQIADASRRYGTNWSNVNVTRIEKGGGKADALPTLMLLLASLNDLTGDSLTLADIFIDYAGTVELADSCVTSYENVAGVLQGKKVSFGYASSDRLKHDVERVAEFIGEDDYDSAKQKYSLQFSTHEGISPAKTPVFNPSTEHKKHFITANHYPTAAEKRLETRLSSANPYLFGQPSIVWAYSKDAERLGLAVAAICDVLYGHSLDEEAAKRAGKDATPQKRGRVTRILADEILDYMNNVAARIPDLDS